MLITTLVLFLSTPTVCPDGIFQLAREIAFAAARQGVSQQLTLKIVPRGNAPTGVDAKGPTDIPAAGWVNTGREWDHTIYVRYDVAHAMNCAAYKLVATHEVCHISLRHVNSPSINPTEKANREIEAWRCTKAAFLNEKIFHSAYDDFVSALNLAERGKIIPEKQSWYFYRGKLRVPQQLYQGVSK